MTTEHAKQAYREGCHAEYRWLKRHPNATREDYARAKAKWDERRSNPTAEEERWLHKHPGATREDYDKHYQKPKHGRNPIALQALREGCSSTEYQWLRKHVGYTREDYAAMARKRGEKRMMMTDDGDK